MPSKRIVITAGGTGGHLYPAQGFAQQLNGDYPDYEYLFMGGGLSSSRYFNSQDFPFYEVACQPLLVKHPIKMMKGTIHLIKGTYQSWRYLKHYRPAAVVGFGSYFTIPVLLAAKILGIPIILHEANSIPGKANKWFAPFAQAIGVHFPYTISRFKKRAIEVGLPLRKGYQKALIPKDQAKKCFGLDPEGLTLLIFGGSQGAQAINKWMQEALALKNSWPFQIIHITGQEKLIDPLQQFYQRQGLRACVKSFEYQMQWAWSAADAFVGRAGASSMAEALEFEVPGILIPYPFATDQHQDHNARFLVETVKGASVLSEKQLNAAHLLTALEELLDPDQLHRKRQSMQAYKQRSTRIDLCQLVMQVIRQGG